MIIELKTQESFNLTEIKQTALAAGIQLSDHDLISLKKWQSKICEKNDWIETDPSKLNQILFPILTSGYLYQGEHLLVLKKIIQIYYQLRIRFDIYTSDEMIYRALGKEFIRTMGNGEYLLKRCAELLSQNGARIRKERELVFYEQNPNNLFVIVEKAHKQEKISSNTASALMNESESLFQYYVAYFNHQTSTSLHRDDFLNIWDMINFMFMHGFKGQDFSSLNEYGIQFYFDKGMKIVESDIHRIEELIKQLEFKRLAIQNEYLQSILVQQIPSYLESLHKYNGLFKIGLTPDNLNYPLFNGLLISTQTDLKGSDLLLYYLKCLKIEQEFCIRYNDELLELAKAFESCKGICMEDLNINLFESVLYQRIASIIGNCDNKILLKRSDVTRIREKLKSCVNKEAEIIRAIEICIEDCTEEAREYIQGFTSIILKRFEEFVIEEAEILIYHAEIDERLTLFINRNPDSSSYFKILSQLEALSDIQEKLHLLQSCPLNIYDLFDLLQSGIFIREEFEAYYSNLSLEEMAVLIKVLISDLGIFNQNEFRLDDLVLELDASIPWQAALLEFLEKSDRGWKKEIEELVKKLHIHFI